MFQFVLRIYWWKPIFRLFEMIQNVWNLIYWFRPPFSIWNLLRFYCPYISIYVKLKLCKLNVMFWNNFNRNMVYWLFSLQNQILKFKIDNPKRERKEQRFLFIFIQFKILIQIDFELYHRIPPLVYCMSISNLCL